MLPSVASPAVLYVSVISEKRHDFLEKRILNIKCVLIFCIMLSEKFLILRRAERDILKNYFGIPVNYALFLCDFNGT
jgi:hypothetical protein